MSGRDRQLREPLRLVIIGGGYAGLTALIALRQRSPATEITLIDPRPAHLLVTRLHETVRRPLREIQVPFQTLAQRFDFVHIQQALTFDESQLVRWNSEKSIHLTEGALPFDYLLIAVGTQSLPSVKSDDEYDLDRLSRQSLSLEIDRQLADQATGEKHFNIVGAGPSGIQFCFELADRLAASSVACRINLIDGHARLLAPFPPAVGRYVEKRLADKGIHLLANHYYLGSDDQGVLLEQARSKQPAKLSSDLTLLLLGKKPRICLHANSSGQVVLDGRALDCVFTAGDCSHYDELGSNLLTSQAAIRKGKAAANNILLKAGVLRFCLPYMHREFGYILSLGPDDAVGWIFNKHHIVRGLPAFLAKQATEAQYDMLLSGVDSYLF